MADVVNLNRFRKRRERDARAESAAHNRVTHGRSAVEREASAELRRREEARLDLHRLEPAGDDTTS